LEAVLLNHKMAGPISIKRQASDYLKRSSQSSLCLVVIRPRAATPPRPRAA
jgi:hypothetical protein